jgi:signal transduction histidine kinase
VATDKHNVFQILFNLLRNAEQAIDETGRTDGLMTVRISRPGDDRVRIEVKDNGVGLSPENLTRIFAHGFTTKSDGHGFGLHSSALVAKKMGGALWAESPGLGLGATFTLDLPLADSSSSANSRVRGSMSATDRSSRPELPRRVLATSDHGPLSDSITDPACSGAPLSAQ